MSGSLEDPPQSLQSPISHSEIFKTVGESKRQQIVASVQSQDVSLGMVDPVTGRSLLHKLLTHVTNGNKIVLDKLDSAVTASGDDPDDDDYTVKVVNNNNVLLT